MNIEAPSAHGSRPRPPAPVPRERPLNPLELLHGLWTNPLATFTRRAFEEPVVLSKSLLGELAIVSDPAAIRHVLVDNAANYRKDELQRRVLQASDEGGNSLLTAEDDDWRQQRRALAALFTPRAVAEFRPAMEQSARWIVERWAPLRAGRRIDVASEMSQLTLDVLTRTIFPSGLGRDPADFARAMADYFDAIGRVHPLDVLGAPKWIPRVGRPQIRRSQGFFEAAVEELVTTRRAWLAAHDGAAETSGLDLLTRLLTARDPQTGAGLGEAEIRANVLTFIGAGHETTANALTWSLFLLALDPGWRAQVEAEVDGLPPAMDALGLEPFVKVRATLEEALRLYPPAASLSRAAIGPDVVAGKRIAAGTVVIIAPYVVHRHQRLWEHPDRFDPERFLPGRREAIGRFAFLPFGTGPRVCIGMGFAMQEAVLLLATMLRHYRLDLMPGHRVEPVQRITLRPRGGMPMLIQRR